MPYFGGEHLPRRWAQIANIAKQTALFSGVPRPAFIDMRTHAWARADRFAWGEDDNPLPTAAPRIAELVNARKDIVAPSSIIHGDLTGNVLFDSTQSPSVIDLTVYWRPINYAIAIIAIDAVCFEDAPLSLLQTISPDDAFPQYLLRALLFRIMTDWSNAPPARGYRIYDQAVDRVQELLNGDKH